MKTPVIALLICLIFACSESSRNNSIELISSVEQQGSIFQNLVTVTNSDASESTLSDSMAFLILPVQASCPSCRKKTIDSIIKHSMQLPNNHYIIISANGGRKTIKGYFQEQNYNIPDIPGKLFLDSSNQAYKFDLYKDKPTIYYSYNRKAYKKVAAIPSTVREDLREFFSGHREK